MKKTLLAVLALSLGTATLAVQAHHEKRTTHNVVLATDGPEPGCLPDCGDPLPTGGGGNPPSR